MDENVNKVPAADQTTGEPAAQNMPADARPAAADAPEEAPTPGGISFGGGANNAYIRLFAESPRYGRTLEEIEQDEQNAEGAVSEETRERYRASAKRRMAETESEGFRPSYESPRQQPNGWMIGGKMVLVDPLDDEMPAPAARAGASGSAPDRLIYPEAEDATTVFPPQQGYVQPIEEEDAPAAPAEETPPQSVPQTGFQRLFSTKKNFAVFSVITGALNILWEFLYFVTIANREIVMSATESTLRSQGQTAYTLTFESPLIGLLKFLMFLLPVFAVIWAILFKRADSKKCYYNRKTVIFFLCLIALAMIVAVVDLTALHLLG